VAFRKEEKVVVAAASSVLAEAPGRGQEVAEEATVFVVMSARQGEEATVFVVMSAGQGEDPRSGHRPVPEETERGVKGRS
jgi:hypothetical protein